MRAALNETFLKFVLGFFAIILGSFCITIALNFYAEHNSTQGASVIESILLDRELQ